MNFFITPVLLGGQTETDQLEIKNYLLHMGWHDSSEKGGLHGLIESCLGADIVLVQLPLNLYSAAALGAAVSLNKPVICIARKAEHLFFKRGHLHPLIEHPGIFERIVADDLLTLCALTHKNSKRAVRKYYVGNTKQSKQNGTGKRSGSNRKHHAHS